jgi:C-terminal processing protease CtpA/Prc
MKPKFLLFAVVLLLLSLALGGCAPKSTPAPAQLATSATSSNTPSEGAAAPAASSEGPVLIKGDFKYTNDFVVETYYIEHAVVLADMTGFVLRDQEWELPIDSQVLGYVKVNAENNSGTFFLRLPAKPAGILNDVDNNGQKDPGVQIFTVAYSPNLYGDPFSVGDDKSLGWPSYLASVVVDNENHQEVTGGKLVVWTPDGAEQFPTGFGPDGLLFTKDDPVGPLEPGYSVIDLDQKPFGISRAVEQTMTLLEPEDYAIKDYSTLSYTEAFDKMFNTVKKEYAFNDIEGKTPDWEKLYTELKPRFEDADKNKDATVFDAALRDYIYAFKDGHVGMDDGDIGNQYFNTQYGGGYGFAIREIEDGRVIVTYVLDGGPAVLAGIQVGAEVSEVNGLPVNEAIGKVIPYSGPFSTEATKRYQQARYLLRAPLGTEIIVKYTNPKGTPKTATLTAIIERQSFSFTSIYKGFDQNALPVEYRILDSGVGYIKINSNYDDLNLIIRLFERALKTFEANVVPGVIIDLRQNSGGSPLGLAGFLNDNEILEGQLEYFSEKTGKFEPEGPRDKVLPYENQYRFGKLALLVGPACASACEIEAYGFSQVPEMLVVGEAATSGVEADVARGQFLLPENFTLQVPTGRMTLPNGSLFLEGVGVVPTLYVPITEENALSSEDVVLKAAEKAVLLPYGAGLEPSGPPTIASKAEAEKSFQGGTVWLEERAREQYDDLPKPGETNTYTVVLSKSEPLIWTYTWCATTKDGLDKNMASTTLKFFMEGEEISLDELVSLSGNFTNQECQVYYTLLDDWPAGEHHLSIEVTFKNAINDGSADYPAGIRTLKYDVFVKP